MLNWEIELKKWCPAFKILTYYGSIKERQLKRQGWTRVNAFHICITSYKIVLQDAKCFRRKKWKYLILDEAQNIKNFKSQRWQTLLNFHSQRRLLLTGTPLQNSLMELWSLMHFLMPVLFASHEEFRQWFSNPLNEMIEQEQMQKNDSLIKRLHKILRPFLLRRLKIDVEKQIPNKQEHVIMCDLSKRQRQLYEDFIQCKSTRDVIEQGHYMSVINILMQLRKVCNHPDLFETRPIISPFVFEKQLIKYEIPKLIFDVNLRNPYLEFHSSLDDTFLCFRIKFTLQATKDMIMNIINRDYNNRDSHRQRIQLTKDIIERYRNSSLWNQSNVPTRNLQNHSEMKHIDVNDHEFQADNIYHEICQQREQERLSRFELLCQINSDRCQSRPLYGSDVLSQIKLAIHPCRRLNRTTFSGYALCQSLTTTRDYMSTTDILRRLIKTDNDRLNEYQDTIDR
jgi:SNF2 family DNA or RNA helicase